jgi:autotransporter-associated beta strand protein
MTQGEKNWRCSYAKGIGAAFLWVVLMSHTTTLLAAPPAGYYLVWSDEFNSPTLDSSKWNIESGARRDAVNTPTAVSMNGTNLVITTYTSGGTHYTAIVETAGKFHPRYGYVEASINYNDSPGMWSAFWEYISSVGSSTCGDDPAIKGTEIDICEHRSVDGSGNNINGKVQVNLHWDGYGACEQDAGSGNVGSNLGNSFHTYGFIWNNSNYRFYIDGAQQWSTTSGNSERSEYLIFSSEVQNGSWAGAIPSGGYGSLATSTTKMLVDYIRYYAPTTTVYWTGAGSTAWTNSANWISGMTPNAGNDVVFSYLSTANLATILPQNFTLNSIAFLETASPVTISGNTLTLGGGGLDAVSAVNDPSIFSKINLSAVQTWKTISGRTLNCPGEIAGSPDLTLAGTGNVNLAASNSFTGKILVAGGDLVITNENALGLNPVTFTSDKVTLDGGAIRSGESGSLASVTIGGSNRGLTLGAGGGTVRTFFNTSLTISNPISGAGSLTKASAGTLNLAAANLFTGNTRVNGGTIVLFQTNALQYSTVDMNASDAGALNLNNLDACLGGLQGSRALALGTGNISVGNNNQFTTYGGVLSGSGSGSLSKIGAGGLTLAGVNTYTGKTFINAGALTITNVSGLGSNPASFTADQLVLNGGALCAGGNFTNVLLNNSNSGITLGTNGGIVMSAFTISNVITGTGSLRVFQPAAVLVAAPGSGFVESFQSTPSGDWMDNGSLIPAGTLVGGTVVTQPFGLAVRGTNVYVAEATAGGRILQFNTVGNFIKTVYTLPAANVPRYLTFGPDGYLYMSDAFGTSGDEVWRFNVTNNTGGVWIPTTFTGGSFNNPQQMVWGPDGYFYIGDRQNNLIRKFDANGSFVGNLATVTQPLALQWDNANNRFLVGAGFSEDIDSVMTDGTRVNFFNGASNEGLLGIVNISGDVYYTRFSTGNSTPGVYRVINSTNSIKVTESIFSANDPGQMVALPTILNMGSLSLAAGNTFAGDSRVSDGTLLLLHSNALQNSTLDMNLSDTGSVNFNGINARLGGLKGARNLALESGTISIGNNGLDTTYSGSLSGIGSFIKIGSGTMTLAGANAYSGSTLISVGTLRLTNSTGSATGSGFVTVAAGATLAGNGKFTGSLILNGNLSPGNGVGVLGSGAATWNGGGVYVWEINDPLTNSGWDLLSVSGMLNIGASPASKFVIRPTTLAGNVPGLLPSFNNQVNYTWTLATATGGVAGLDPNAFTVDTSSFSNSLSGGAFTVEQTGGAIVLKFHANTFAPQFTSATLTAGVFQFSATGVPGKSYILETTTNLVSPVIWQTLTNLTADVSGALQFNDVNAVNLPQRFYRLTAL